MNSQIKKIAYIILGILFLIAVLIWLAVFSLENQKLEIIFFDIGQGDSILINTKNNPQILIDGGPNNSVVDKLGEILPFYDKKIELIILTHPDKDHISGLVEVVKRYKADKILTTGIECSTEVCQILSEQIQKKKIPVEIAQAGQIISIDNNIFLGILNPLENLSGKNVKNKNDTSIVAKLIAGENSVLLTGDITSKTEENLIENNFNLQSDFLKIAHHGSKYSTSENFLNGVSPKAAIISVGKNSWGMPTKEVLEKLDKSKIKAYRTDIDGDVKIVFEGNNFKIQSEK
jgi:competence protein ComEC